MRSYFLFSRMPHFDEGGLFFGTMTGFLIFRLLGLALLVILGTLLYRHLRKSRIQEPVDPALEALKLSYAEGEIDEETYLKRKTVLGR